MPRPSETLLAVISVVGQPCLATAFRRHPAVTAPEFATSPVPKLATVGGGFRIGTPIQLLPDFRPCHREMVSCLMRLTSETDRLYPCHCSPRRRTLPVHHFARLVKISRRGAIEHRVRRPVVRQGKDTYGRSQLVIYLYP